MSESSVVGSTIYKFQATLPSPRRQLSYFATGSLAGLATLPVEGLWSRFHKPGQVATHFSKHFPKFPSAAAIVYRAGVRFWMFDVTRSQLNRQVPSLPVAVTGGLSGAAGGFAEICVQSLAATRPRLPALASVASQSVKLFFCFGTYTFLSTTLSPDQLPPKPFPFCWALGAMAGGLGTGMLARLEGVKGPALWRSAAPKGALIIGTVIAVQVTSCAEVLQRVEM